MIKISRVPVHLGITFLVFLVAACTADATPAIDAPQENETAAVAATHTPVQPPTPEVAPSSVATKAAEEETDQPDQAANADVVFVVATQEAGDSWRFAVTVAHPDTGWEDYADGWDIVLPDGTVLKPDADSPFTRLLLHPHETEQPFTRSQSGVRIPPEISTVTVRAHDLVDGFGGREVKVDLTTSQGQDFEVRRPE